MSARVVTIISWTAIIGTTAWLIYMAWPTAS